MMTRDFQMIEKLEPHITDNGVVIIDSIFRFSESPESLPAFLGMAHMRGCTVIFENEGYTFSPKKKKSDSLADSLKEPILIHSLMVYLQMDKELSMKKTNYMLNLTSSDAPWVKGVHEPILTDDITPAEAKR